MTDQERKDSLRKAINKSRPSVHCDGCDEWCCSHDNMEQQEEKATEKVLKAVWKEIQSWEGGETVI